MLEGRFEDYHRCLWSDCGKPAPHWFTAGGLNYFSCSYTHEVRIRFALASQRVS